MERQGKLYRSVLTVATVTGLILLVPFIAMQYTDEVVWTASDFIIMGALLFTIGMLYALATRSAPNIIYRAAMTVGFGAMLFMIWANLAVGLIGSGPHAGNLMYIGVIVVAIIGTLRSGLRPSGLEQAMYAVAAALVLVAAIALLTGMHRYSGSSVTEILGVNAFLAMPFVIAGLLFRFAGQEQSRTHGHSGVDH